MNQATDMNNEIGITAADNAIIVVDMQNDFVLPGAQMRVMGAYDTIPAIQKFLEFGRSKRWAIIYAYRVHRPTGVDAELFRKHFFLEGKPFCIPGTKGAEVVEAIAPKPGDIEITKHRFSAFFGTDLDIVLRGLGAKNLYIVGTQYPNCIRSTAVDAMGYDYNATVVTDCCSAATDEVAKANVYDIRNMGIPCVSSEDIMAATK